MEEILEKLISRELRLLVEIPNDLFEILRGEWPKPGFARQRCHLKSCC